jgi:Co/Zn/Cd efflux system component
VFEALTNRFIPNTKESAKMYRTKIGVFQGWISVLVNSILFIFKLVIGVMVGAVSVIADAVHTLFIDCCDLGVQTSGEAC